MICDIDCIVFPMIVNKIAAQKGNEEYHRYDSFFLHVFTACTDLNESFS